MRAQLPASPDDVDFAALAGAVKRQLGKLLLAPGLVDLVSVAVLSFIAPKYSSPSVDKIALLAMTATFLLVLTFVITRGLFDMAQQALSLPRPVRAQESLVVSARRLIANAQDKTGWRNVAVGEAVRIDADEVAEQLARGMPAMQSTSPWVFQVRRSAPPSPA
jgi:hypothetical protein